MKNPILIILALLAGLLPAQAQFQSVTTTANGTLHSPTNLWAQNSLAIANALAANPGVPVVRRLTESSTFVDPGVWLYAGNATITLETDGEYTATIVNAGPGTINLSNDSTPVDTIRPGETLTFRADDEEPVHTVLSRFTPAPLPTTNGLLARTGDGQTAARTITAGDSNIIWTNGSGVSGNPTSTINATQTGNRTYAANLTVQGNTTLGDASGDTVTINAATINAANANATDSNSIAKVGALDGRYIQRDPRSRIYLFDDFISNSAGGATFGSFPWIASGTIGTAASPATSPIIGFLAISNNGTINGGLISNNTSAINFRMATWILQVSFQVNPITNVRYGAGIGQAVDFAAASTQFTGYVYDSAVSANWLVRVQTGTNITNHDTGIAVANNTRYHLRLRWDGSSLFVAIASGTGAFSAEQSISSANLPNSSQTASFVFGVNNSESVTKTLTIDYWLYEATTSR